jgi:restriction endonuclease S subunit
LDFSELAVRYVKKSKINELSLSIGDILIEKSGGSPVQPVGRVALITTLDFDKPVLFSNFLSRIRVKSKDTDSYYIFAYLQTLYKMNYMEFIQNQTTGIKNLIMEEFLSIPVVLGGKDEQKQIATNYFNNIVEAKKLLVEVNNKLKNNNADIAKKIFI